MPWAQQRTREGGRYPRRVPPGWSCVRGAILGAAIVLLGAGRGQGAPPSAPDLGQVRRMADQLDTPGAHKALVQILAATPNSPEAHYHLGRVLLSYDPPGYE